MESQIHVIEVSLKIDFHLSRVEQGAADLPTAERVTIMAELLEVNTDEMIALVGRVPEDLPAIIQRQPAEMPELLRETIGLSGGQLRKRTSQI